MGDYIWYVLFLFAWTFAQSLWLSKLARQVAELRSEVNHLRSGSQPTSE